MSYYLLEIVYKRGTDKELFFSHQVSLRKHNYLFEKLIINYLEMIFFFFFNLTRIYFSFLEIFIFLVILDILFIYMKYRMSR